MPVDYQQYLRNIEAGQRDTQKMLAQNDRNPIMSGQLNPGLVETGMGFLRGLPKSGLAKTGARLAGLGFLGNTIVGGIGAIGNFANRLGQGQNLGSAAVATLGDTANYMAFGLGGENAGDRLVGALGLPQSPDEKVKQLKSQMQGAMQAGNSIEAARIGQEIEKTAEEAMRSYGIAEKPDPLSQSLEQYGRVADFKRQQSQKDFEQDESNARDQIRFRTGNQALGEFLRSQDLLRREMLQGAMSFRY